ncbi:GNAT family N-acetyltransferase [Luteimicrobium subarcticum]|uniref:Ribosomal protein S18 acetylase RimI-like enzyme n=1 Tax=Luteimicrobium subarcticum TaxID=620910 RepID=A0A2M8WQP8_9MICO|nr:GNAT family N-acetyltransferase [Luteimicrobium subarcticum]PJI93258.1 ribosomal protein S18 acetylase RimI-like enzyme [Luteimicrobium subarcticum]
MDQGTHEPETVTIRVADTDDAEAIATVHIASWRGAYAGIVPDAYLASLDQHERARAWRTWLGDGSHDTWVALGDGRTLGFASVGPARDEDAEPGDLELYSIYLDPEAWGRGVARDLMRTVLATVSAGATITLWVLADNDRARHFYRRHGFAPDGVERREDLGGADLTEVRYRRRA